MSPAAALLVVVAACCMDEVLKEGAMSNAVQP